MKLNQNVFKSVFFLGAAMWAIILLVALATCHSAHAGTTKVSSPIIVNKNWDREDSRGQFYQYEFPQMYNKVVRDLDTLYYQVSSAGSGASTDSIYKLRMKAQRAWIDTVKTAIVHFPGQIDVDTLLTRIVPLKGLNSRGVINSDSLQIGSGTLVTKVYTAADSLYFVVAGGDTLAIGFTRHLGPH
jgi:hypothetical protein